MLNTKLILIEGLPGAGKSTTTARLGRVLQGQHIACRWFLEEDEPHPIACLDFETDGLGEKVLPLWRDFAAGALQEPVVTIIESRLWQNTGLYMYMSERPLAEILGFNQQVLQVLRPLSPALVYLDQPDTAAALHRLYSLRGEKWIEENVAETAKYRWFQSRGLKDFGGWIRFFEEWQAVVERSYAEWPYEKVRILDPHQDRASADRQLGAFLQVDLNSA